MKNVILLSSPITSEELSRLINEFPQYEILRVSAERPIATLGIDILGQVEIFYGEALEQNELRLLPHLHWIHNPTSHLDRIATGAIKKQENILITMTKEENVEQVAEFALAVALAFTKNLCRWFAPAAEEEIETLRRGMWSAKETHFLQIGLGTIGTEITRRVQQEGFKVMGASDVATFHSYCQKSYTYNNLPEVLPQTEIICVALPRDRVYKPWFNRHYMKYIKDDALLILIGPASAIHFEDLTALYEEKRLRGICIDAPVSNELSLPPHCLRTYQSAGYPVLKNQLGFQTFIYNLRQFLHGNLTEMKNVITL